MEACNAEDSGELEVQLYGQVQHGSISEISGMDMPPAVCTDKRFNKINYWKNGRSFGTKKNINPFAGFSRPKNCNILKDGPSKGDLHTFKPYTPLLLHAPSEVLIEKNSTHMNSGEQTKRADSDHEELAASSKIIKNFLPSNKNMTKLRKVMKYQAKKLKATRAREKRKKCINIETISLNSSDDEVVEIPLPAPPTVTIESSEESETESVFDSFLKPRNNYTKTGKVGSRCVSPSSVISDDFIGHTDRSRLLEQKNVADDEDLQYLQESVGSFLCKNDTNTELLPTHDGVPIDTSVKCKKQNNAGKDYNVDHSSFRATDVYESESSDMPDCDQETICLQSKNSLDPDLQNEMISERTKKLTKRRKSSESKSKMFPVPGDWPFKLPPHLHPGEAIEWLKTDTTTDPNDGNSSDHNDGNSSDHNDGNSSDHEFISLLKNISQPLATLEDSSKSDESDSARSIARLMVEDVLNKRNKVSPNTSADAKDTEEGDALPDNTEDIDKLLDNIDKIHTTIESVSTSDEPENIEELEYVGDKEVLCVSDLVKETSVDTIENDNNGLHIVFTHGKNVGWTEEMERFYNWSWGQEKFNVRGIRKMMDVSANWMICTQDRFPRVHNYRKLKCHNCCEFGHIRAKCPQPKKDLICYMCGEKGHLEPRCPNTICLRCGKKTNVFTKSCNMCSHENRLICPICKIRGHSIQLCPDKWRRYHSTTEPNDYPNKNIEFNQNKYCCICARRGHLSDNCKSAFRFFEYPPSVCEIKSYAKAYDDNLIKFPHGRNMMGYALLSYPCDSVLFKFSRKATKKQYYGRFLNAVGMDYLMALNKKKTHLKHRTNCEPADGEPDHKISKNSYVLNPFAQSLNKHELCSKINLNYVEDKNISNAISEDAKNSEENEDILNKKIEVSFDKSQSEALAKQNEVAYNAFSERVNNNQSTPSSVKKLSRPSDFIPLSTNCDEFENYKDGKIGISKNLQLNVKYSDNKSIENIKDSCEAKMYLTKFHSTFLLSTEGNKFLTESCKKYNLKAKVEWTSVGNALILEGSLSDQDNFHKEFSDITQKLLSNTKRKEREKFQEVPKKRNVLIRFLQQELLQLQNNYGNVLDHYKRFQSFKNQQSRSALRTTQKLCRILNMILIGQTGLKEGRKRLEALSNKIKMLKENIFMDVVPNETRREIYENWKYIFSSQEYENYEDLMRQYHVLKRSNELPAFKLNCSFLNRESTDVSLTDEQKEKLNADSNLQMKINNITSSDAATNNKNNIELESQSSDYQPPPKNLKTHGRELKSKLFNVEKPQVGRNWKHRYTHPSNRSDQLYGRWISNQNQQHENLNTSLLFWSRKSMKFIDKCLYMNPASLPIISKLEKVREKAKQGLLSNNDYRAILQIYNTLRGAVN